MWLKAPFIVTLEGPVLREHAILVKNGWIRQIVSQKELPPGSDCLELPNTILLPGLINCHCHLELSQLPSPLPYPGSFVGWIEQLTQLKLQMTPQQVESSLRFGIQQSLTAGTTTIADHLSVTTSPQILFDSPLDGIAYIEVLGVEKQRAQYFYDRARELENHGPKSKFAVRATPHSPYSLLPEIFSKIISDVERRTQNAEPLSIHIAESAEEYLLFKEGRGPLFEFLQMKGKAPATRKETPLQYLHWLQLLPYGALAVHANYLDDEDITLLNRHEISVIHCPSSHAYFEHDRFPMGLLQDGAINIALGTDSLASSESLSMIRQMQIALDNYAELTPETVLKMATLNGARALWREKEIGSLQEGKLANIIGVPLQSGKHSIYENILLSEKVTFSTATYA